MLDVMEKAMKFHDLFGKESYDWYAKACAEEIELAVRAGKDGNAYLRKKLLADRARYLAKRICPVLMPLAVALYLYVALEMPGTDWVWVTAIVAEEFMVLCTLITLWSLDYEERIEDGGLSVAFLAGLCTVAVVGSFYLLR